MSKLKKKVQKVKNHNKTHIKNLKNNFELELFGDQKLDHI